MFRVLGRLSTCKKDFYIEGRGQYRRAKKKGRPTLLCVWWFALCPYDSASALNSALYL